MFWKFLRNRHKEEIKRITAESEKFKQEIIKEYDQKYKDALKQFKDSLEAISKRNEENIDFMIDTLSKEHQVAISKIREQERKFYLPRIEELRKEIDRLHKAIDDRAEQFAFTKNQRRDMKDLALDIANLLQTATKKNSESIQCTERVLKMIISYGEEQKKVEDKYSKIEMEV